MGRHLAEGPSRTAGGCLPRRWRTPPRRLTRASTQLLAVMGAMTPSITGVVVGAPSTAFAAPTATLPATQAAPTVTVPATQAWTDTGVDVAGAVSLKASGTIQVGGPEPNLGPAGSTTGCVAGPGAFSGSWVANGFPCWSLIARVGNGPAFYVGDGVTLTVPSGRLLLGVDDETAAFGDNSGSWTVQVSSSASNCPTIRFIGVSGSGETGLGAVVGPLWKKFRALEPQARLYPVP